LSSVVPPGFVLPRGFVEGIIRKDETCPPRVEADPEEGATAGPDPDCFVLISHTPAFRLDARPAAWQTDPHRGSRRAKGLSADATLWSSEAWASAPDVSLLVRTREGSAEAFGELWRRHLPAAYAVAGRHRGRSAPEDIVAEAAARVLALIRAGKGPDEHFRAYFLSAVRSVAIDQGRRDLRVVPTEADDLEVLADPADDPFEGLATDDEGLALVREAFAGLSERDQRVLWHTTVEGAAPRAVAPALGMTANAVSVRAMRARESLRALYLDARAERGLAAADTDECRWTVTHLGALVRGRLPKRQTERAEAHVAECPHAATIAADLRVIHDGFPALIVPLALLAGLGTPGFLSLPAVVGLSGGAGAAGFAGFAGGAGGPAPGAGAPAPPAPSPSSSSSAGSGVDAVAQVASRVTGLVAGLAVSAGVAGALALPGASLAAPSATASPVPSATASSAAPGARAGTGAGAVPGASPRAVVTSLPISPTGLPTRTISASPIPSAATRTSPSSGDVAPDPGSTPSTVGGTPVPRGGTSAESGGATPATPAPPTGTATGRPTTPPATTPPAPPTTRPPSPSPTPPAPTTTPPAPQPGGVAPTITVRLVSGRDPARISVRVRSQVGGSMTVRISNASGAGTLSVRNSSWTCAQTSTSAVRCAGERGQALLEQSGTGATQAVVVRVTDAAGDTWTETLRPT